MGVFLWISRSSRDETRHIFMWLSPSPEVTPSGQPTSQPQEYQDGEAGFALMIPSMDGVTIRPFHFCKQTLSKTALEEAGRCPVPSLAVSPPAGT